MKNIYVGNISFKTTEEDLNQAFAAYGQVERVQIVKDRETGQARGFAFVEMPVDSEADKAMAALNGADLGGRTLTVNEARPREPRTWRIRRRRWRWRQSLWRRRRWWTRWQRAIRN